MTSPRARHTRLTLAIVAAALATVALVLTLTFRTRSGQQFRQQSYTNCMTLEALKAALVAVFRDAEASTPHDTGAHDFYQREINRFKPAECAKP